MSLKITWLGHSALEVVTDGFKLLVDPYLSDNPTACITPGKAEADYILLSHGHGDHLGDTITIAKRDQVKVITNFEICNWLSSRGVETHAQHIGGGFHHPFGYLKFTQAVHGSALPDGHYGGNPAGFLLSTNDGKKVYMACDTGLFGDMRLIGEEGIDVAVLPIGDNFTMGPDDALRAVTLIQPKHVIPIHYNTWELISQDPEEWKQRVEAETDAKVHVLQPGECLDLP